MSDSISFKFKDLRREYGNRGLRRKDLDSDPFIQFMAWFEEAKESGAIEPNAFSLATATRNGIPSCRLVLMKHFDENGLLFFTNTESRKAKELDANPYAAATFWWGNMERELRIEGFIRPVAREVAEAYFAMRPRKSQIGAIISRQDAPLSSKKVLEDAYQLCEAQFEGLSIPCPEYWGGYQLIPQSFEFWQGSEARLHDRFLYQQTGDGQQWQIQRLYP